MFYTTDMIVIHREEVVRAIRKVPCRLRIASNHKFHLMRLLRSARKDQMTWEQFYRRVADWVNEGRISTHQDPRHFVNYYLPFLEQDGMVSVTKDVLVEV